VFVPRQQDTWRDLHLWSLAKKQPLKVLHGLNEKCECNLYNQFNLVEIVFEKDKKKHAPHYMRASGLAQGLVGFQILF